MASHTQQFTLPELRSVCPFEAATNPHYAQVRAENEPWIYEQRVFDDSKCREFVEGNNELLVSHSYPFADLEAFSTVCNFVNVLFVVDEVSDEQRGSDARGTCNTFLRAMQDAEFDDGTQLCKMTAAFRARWMRRVGPYSANRFYEHCKRYIECVTKEAELRERREVLPLDAYTDLRRENSAIRLCFGLFEYALGIDLPDDVFSNEVFKRMYWAGADMVCWANDVYSYAMEYARGIEGNNYVTVLMEDNDWSLQQASDHVGLHFQELVHTFIAAKEELAATHTFDPEVYSGIEKFTSAMENWVSGNEEWSFETDRYFGPLLQEVKRTRQVTFQRKAKTAPQAAAV